MATLPSEGTAYMERVRRAREHNTTSKNVKNIEEYAFFYKNGNWYNMNGDMLQNRTVIRIKWNR